MNSPALTRRGGALPENLGRFLAAASDPRVASWQVALCVLLAYLGLAAITSGPPAAVYPLGWSVLAVAGTQWLLLCIAHHRLRSRSAPTGHMLVVITVNVVIVAVASVIVERSLTSVPARAVLLILITIAWTGIADYRREVALARRLQAEVTAARVEGISRVRQQRQEVFDEVSEMVESTFVDQDDALQASGRLRYLAHERIRPLSHELAASIPAYRTGAVGAESGPHWTMILARTLREPAIDPFLAAALITGVVGFTGSFSDSAGVNLLQLALTFLVTVILAGVIVRGSRPLLLRRSWLGRTLLTAASLAALTMGVDIAVYLISGQPLTVPSSTGLADRLVLSAVVFGAAALAVLARSTMSLLDAARSRTDELTAELAWEVARTNETIAQERRQLATALHGPLQSAVVSVAMALEETDRRGEDPDDVWRQAQVVLGSLVAGLAAGPAPRRGLVRDLEAVRATWDGLCEVTIAIDDSVIGVLESDSISAASTIEVITEAVANAAMHAAATAIDVAIDRGPERTVRIRVHSNGTPIAPDRQPGLGTRQLDEVAMHWHRDRTPEGTTLTVLLPAPL